MQRTLLRRKAELANAAIQREILEGESKPTRQPYFDQQLRDSVLSPLRTIGVEILQVNFGKVCNQTCTHCHVDAGPDRRESMTSETAEAVIDVLARTGIPT